MLLYSSIFTDFGQLYWLIKTKPRKYMSYLRITRCVCGAMPARKFDYQAREFILTCVNETCEHRFFARSGNEALTIFNWRRLVSLGREHEEAKTRNLEELVLVCDSARPKTNGNNSDQFGARTFLEASLKPDPESGFGARANSDADPRRFIDYNDPELLAGSEMLGRLLSEYTPFGIPASPNPEVAFIRRIGGHASGGGGPC